MNIVSIFDFQKRPAPCHLWAVCYPEDRIGNEDIDIFTKLFDQWNDITYLQQFFTSHYTDLSHPIWQGISIDEAIDQVLDEAAAFEDELKGIEEQLPEFAGKTIGNIFEPLHKNEFILKIREQRFRKGKPDFHNPMLRLYGIALEEDCMVITGGAIKLTHSMEEPHLQTELARLRRVQDFLNSQHIYSREGLEEL